MQTMTHKNKTKSSGGDEKGCEMHSNAMSLHKK